jgi:hypothetical protein
LPAPALVLLHYVLLHLAFRYLLHPFARDVLERQLVGARDLLLLTLAIMAYLLLCAVPPFLWSRGGVRRPFSRGIESFVCYAAVTFILNAVFLAAAEVDTGYLSGLAAGSSTWERALSAAVLFLAFLAAAYAGAGRASGRGRIRRR